MKLIPPNITPGPWALEAGRAIVTPTGTFNLTYGHEKGTNAPRFTSPTQLDRNAQAIAALPQCLEALEKLLAVANAGAIMRHETGKPQWSILDEIKNQIKPALLAAGYKVEGGEA